MWLYLVLLISSISVPFIMSFEKQLQFYKQWKYLFLSMIIVAFFFIIFDIYFTKHGVWGFNPQFHLNILLFNLPLEEWLFFIVIPYASIFIHESLVLYFPHFQLNTCLSRALSISLISTFTIILLLNLNKIYTVYIFSLLILALVLAQFDKAKVIRRYYLTFLVIIIPFAAVNAILTGSFMGEKVFLYNNNEILGIRFLTIPVEDFGYAFSLILFNLLLFGKLKKSFSRRLNSE